MLRGTYSPLLANKALQDALRNADEDDEPNSSLLGFVKGQNGASRTWRVILPITWEGMHCIKSVPLSVFFELELVGHG